MTYGSFDYTSLLYLSDYSKDFGGGRFVFMDADSNKTVEPRAGMSPGCAIYCWAGRCCGTVFCVSSNDVSNGAFCVQIDDIESKIETG